MIFGNDSAENDDLLQACEVFSKNADRTKQIVTGRWGVGKTAHLLLSNATLAKALLDVDEELERIWLIDERSIDSGFLLQEYQKSQSSKEFRRRMESMWKAEIIRRAAIILSKLSENYGNVTGQHWQFVHKTANAKRARTSLWSQIPHALNILASFDIVAARGCNN